MLKHLQKLLLLAALCVPWVTQAQCTSGVSCPFSVTMYGTYDDSWSYDGNITLGVYQNGTLVATLSGNGSTEVTENVTVCSGDSVFVVVTSWFNDYYECSFSIDNVDGSSVVSDEYISDYSLGDTVARFEPVCPSCIAPSGLAADVSDPDAVVLSWIGQTNALSYEVVVLASTATFDPTNVTPTTVSDTFTVVTDLTPARYNFYVRANCGSGDYSTWAGPFFFSTSPDYYMPLSGTNTLQTCNLNVYDDGGPTGSYSTGCNATLNVYPNDPTKILKLYGFSETEGTYDYLTITDLATNEVVFCDNDSPNGWTIDTMLFYNGVSLSFYSDGSVTYGGFDVHVVCVDPPTCIPVQNLAIVNASPDSIYLGWIDTNNSGASYLVEYRPADSTDWASVVVYDTYAEIGDLMLNRLYEFKVTAMCSSTDYSSVVGPISGRTLAGAPISEFPYTCGFEYDADNDIDQAANWVLSNGDATNAWYVGSAVQNGGTKSLYISNDNASSNNYSTSSTSHVWAYATFAFTEPGQYVISYDWKSQGESHYYDYLRVFLAPASIEFEGGSPSPLGTSTYSAASASLPAGCIELSGRTSSPYTLALSNTWNTVAMPFTITNQGLYKLVFFWSNDGGGGTNPPAAVDNIVVNQLTCPAPTSFAIDTIEAHQVTLNWTAIGDESEWLVRANANGQTGDWESVTSTPYIMSGLSSATNYTFQLVALCGAGDTSLVVSTNGTTAISCPAPTNFAATVDSTSGDIVLTWTDDSGSNWDVVYGPLGVNPYTSDDIESVSTNSYQISNLNNGFYEAYVRTNCGNDDYSSWVGPLPFNVGIVVMNMNAGNDTVYTCNAIIYDNGGPNGNYSNSFDGTIVVYPDQPNNGFLITGQSQTEGSWDYVTVYDGVGTSGTMLFRDNTSGDYSVHQIGPFMTEGPVTIAFHADGSSTYSGFEINLTCQALSDCATPAYVNVSSVSNNQATLAWSDTSNAWNGSTVLWGTANDISQATDSVTLAAGVNNYTITGLTGTTTYYAWVRGECSEPSRAIQVNFTTTVDCAPVEGLHVSGVDYHAFALEWNAPTVGNNATQYVVAWKHANASTWNTDTVTDTYYYINGLGIDSTYNYRVTTICDQLYANAVSGTVQTRGCGIVIGSGDGTSSYLPSYSFYDYSYTQQIILDEEMDNLDSIATIAFYNAGSDVPRNIVIYMGNTTQSSFSSTTNYVPFADLDTVYEGQLSGTGWVTLPLTNTFARTTGSNLVIAVDDNTGSWSSGPSWRTSSTATTRGMYFYQDGTNIDPQAPSASNYSTVNYVNQVRLVPPTCVFPDCAAPIVSLSNIDQHSVTVNFPVETGSTYEVSYKLVSESNWTVAEAANTTGNVNITGLNASANYMVRVTTDCNGTTLSGSASFWTLCGPVSVPLFVNFEDMNYGDLSINCWTTGSTNLGTTYPNPSVVSLTGDPNKLLILYNGAYVILPQMAAPLNELQARFSFTQGGDSVRLLIGLMDNPSLPISSMTVLDTLVRSDYDTTTSTVQITYSFANTGVTDSSKYIAFWDAFNDNYSFIDNLNIEFIPACSPVANLAVANVGTTTADVSWTTTGTSAAGYIVEYGPHGFVPGSAAGTTVAATGTSTTLTGLNHSTYYDVYVYAACTALGDTSIAAGPLAFITNCAALTELPYFTNFENIVPAGTGSNNYSYRPNCWTVADSGIVPHVYYTTATNYAPSQAYALRVVDDGYLVLNEMGVDLDTLMLSFHDYNFSPNTYGIVVGAVDNNGAGFESTFVPIDTIVFPSSNESIVTSYLVNYTGSANYIALKFYGNNGTGTAHYIDNFTIDYVPSCIAPQRVHAVSITNVDADLAWSFSQAPSYSIEYGVQGFALGTGTTVTSTTNSISLTNLTPDTYYDVYLVSSCGSDTVLYTFRTLVAAPATVPYDCDFQAADNNGWELLNGTQGNYWMVGTENGANRALFITDNGTTAGYSGSASTVFATRTINISQAGEYAYSFDWKCEGESSFDYLRAALVPVDADLTPGNLSGFGSTSEMPAGAIALDGAYRLNLNSTWTTQEGLFTLSQPGAYMIVFMWHNDGSVYHLPPAQIDNVSIMRNSCPAPTGLTATLDPSATSAVVDWTDVQNPVSWIVEYGPSGFVHGSEDATAISATSHPVTISGLSNMTTYDIYVRPVCTDSDSGRWVRTSLTTPMCADPLLAQSFDTSMSQQTSIYAPIGYSYYNYGYTQTIIDASRMADMAGDIQAFAFQTASTSAGSYFNHMDVYMANVSESDLSNGFIHPDSAHVFVQVISDGNFNYDSIGWFEHIFDTPFTWDGQSNVLIAVNRRNGSYSSGSSFVVYSDSTTTAKTRHVYTDGSAYDINSVSNGTAYDYVGAMKFFSCGAGCSRPAGLSVTAHDYSSATVQWSGNAAQYEVAVKAANVAVWPDGTTVTTNTYTATELTPATNYQIRVRAICDANEGLISDWVTVNFTTDSLPCFAPSALQNTAVDLTTATFDWTAGGEETMWNIHVWNTSFDQYFEVTSHPATVTGLTQTTTYNVAVSALCGNGATESEFSDTIQFTTATCPAPTAVAVSGITAHSAVVTWQGSAANYTIEYGETGFAEGTGTQVNNISATTYTIEGLESGYIYDVYVRSDCDAHSSSDWSSQTFTTAVGIDAVDGVNVTLYPNPTSTSTVIALSGVNGEVSITIVDMNGRTVRTDSMSCEGDCVKTIEVSGLAQGAYFVRVNGDNVNAVKKLVVK